MRNTIRKKIRVFREGMCVTLDIGGTASFKRHAPMRIDLPIDRVLRGDVFRIESDLGRVVSRERRRAG